jgi:hypothetical protein
MINHVNTAPSAVNSGIHQDGRRVHTFRHTYIISSDRTAAIPICPSLQGQIVQKRALQHQFYKLKSITITNVPTGSTTQEHKVMAGVYPSHDLPGSSSVYENLDEQEVAMTSSNFICQRWARGSMTVDGNEYMNEFRPMALRDITGYNCPAFIFVGSDTDDTNWTVSVTVHYQFKGYASYTHPENPTCQLKEISVNVYNNGGTDESVYTSDPVIQSMKRVGTGVLDGWNKLIVNSTGLPATEESATSTQPFAVPGRELIYVPDPSTGGQRSLIGSLGEVLGSLNANSFTLRGLASNLMMKTM